MCWDLSAHAWGWLLQFTGTGFCLPSASLGYSHGAPGSVGPPPPCPCPWDYSSNRWGWPEFCHTLYPWGVLASHRQNWNQACVQLFLGWGRAMLLPAQGLRSAANPRGPLTHSPPRHWEAAVLGVTCPPRFGTRGSWKGRLTHLPSLGLCIFFLHWVVQIM